MLPNKCTLSLLCCVFFFLHANGTPDTPDQKSLFDWFHEPDEILEAELQANLDSLFAIKMTNEFVPATFRITRLDEEEIELPVKIRARGRYRRKICDFPPLKLDFDKDILESSGLKKYDEYKLVTHCFSKPGGKQNVMKEYLTYKLYQILSDRSYRVQLIKIRYRNDRGKTWATSYGFLIEDEKELAKRLNATVNDDRFGITKDSLDLKTVHTHDLFQCMIGNTDWSLLMNRNLKLLCDKENPAYYPVPYDFDFSGVVNASYAIPNSDYNQKNIRERFFLGTANSTSELQSTLAHFQNKKEEMLRMVKGFKPLDGTSRRDIIKYLNTFYDSLKDGTFEEMVAK